MSQPRHRGYFIVLLSLIFGLIALFTFVMGEFGLIPILTFHGMWKRKSGSQIILANQSANLSYIWKFLQPNLLNQA
ncbi:hypothetical protein NIES4075_70080 [Tolypothrix sp. NIES-4075]|nr:hypothetical protein NIES4075_70080 [Tolypothrix sp. NIES-4075]